jgi:hypothetical protein
MSSALDDYRAKFLDRHASAPPVQDRRALRAAIMTDTGQVRDTRAHLLQLIERAEAANLDAIVPAWQDAIAYFSGSAAVDPQTGQRRSLPPYQFCDGSLCHSLDHARHGLAAAQRKIAEVAQARRDLAAADVRLAGLAAILAELDAETAPQTLPPQSSKKDQ